MGEIAICEDQDKKLFSTSLLHFCYYQFSHLIYRKKYFLFKKRKSFQANLPVESFVFFLNPLWCSAASCALAFLVPSLHVWVGLWCPSRAICPHFHCLYIYFSHLSLTCSFLLSCAGFLPSLFDFLHMRIESSYAQGKVLVKVCQLQPIPLSLGTITRGSHPLILKKSGILALLKFRMLISLFFRPISLKITDSTKAWSLQSGLPPISSSVSVSTRSNNSSLLIRLSLISNKTLSSINPQASWTTSACCSAFPENI